MYSYNNSITFSHNSICDRWNKNLYQSFIKFAKNKTGNVLKFANMGRQKRLRKTSLEVGGSKSIWSTGKLQINKGNYM